MGSLTGIDAGVLHSLDELEATVAYFSFLVVCNADFTALSAAILVVVTAFVEGRNVLSLHSCHSRRRSCRRCRLGWW